MMDMSDELAQELRELFLTEAGDLLDQTEGQFLNLEKYPEDMSIVESLFRFFHNMKGSSKAVGMDSFSEFTHHVENLLVQIKKKEMPVNAEVISILLDCCDRLKNNLTMLREGLDQQINNSDLNQRIELCIEKKGKMETSSHSHSDHSNATPANHFEDQNLSRDGHINELEEEIKVFEKTVDDVFSVLEVQDKVCPPEQSLEKSASQKNDPNVLSMDNKKQEEFIRISLKKIDDLVNYFGEQVILQSSLEYAKTDLKRNTDLLEKTIGQLSKITYDLQQTAISLRMISIKTLFSKMERIVRDVSKILEKKITLHKTGEDSELDKTILEAILDPLTHMVRNSVDHGIETPEERKKAGKDEAGNIYIDAFQRGGLFYIQVTDDGKGLDRDKILKKAIEAGIADSKKDYSDQDIYNMIFHSGLTTKDKTTEISGRGVGMDVVKSSIEKMKGSCTIASTLGKGSTFTIRLPQSLAIFNGLIVRVGHDHYVVPNADIFEVIKFNPSSCRKMGDEEVFEFKEQVINIVDLRTLYKTPADTRGDSTYMLVVSFRDKLYGLKVDELLKQQRIVYKNVGPDVKKTKGVVGGTILGDGKVALILSPYELLAKINNKKVA